MFSGSLTLPFGGGGFRVEQSRQILLSAGVILTFREDEDYGGELMDRVSRELQAAVKLMAAASGVCESSGVVKIHYLGDESENAARCSLCGRWTSDINRSIPVIDGIPDGDVQDGRLVCFRCQYLERERKNRTSNE